MLVNWHCAVFCANSWWKVRLTCWMRICIVCASLWIKIGILYLDFFGSRVLPPLDLFSATVAWKQTDTDNSVNSIAYWLQCVIQGWHYSPRAVAESQIVFLSGNSCSVPRYRPSRAPALHVLDVFLGKPWCGRFISHHSKFCEGTRNWILKSLKAWPFIFNSYPVHAGSAQTIFILQIYQIINLLKKKNYKGKKFTFSKRIYNNPQITNSKHWRQLLPFDSVR